MPRLEAVDARAVGRAAKGLAPLLARRGWPLGRPDAVRALIRMHLAAIEDDDPFEADALLWCRVEPSGLVLVGVGRHAYIVARAAPRGGRARRLLVP